MTVRDFMHKQTMYGLRNVEIIIEDEYSGYEYVRFTRESVDSPTWFTDIVEKYYDLEIYFMEFGHNGNTIEIHIFIYGLGVKGGE